jgi:hypothetical protein
MSARETHAYAPGGPPPVKGAEYAVDFDKPLGRFVQAPERGVRGYPVTITHVIASSQLLYRLCCLFPVRLDTTTWRQRWGFAHVARISGQGFHPWCGHASSFFCCCGCHPSLTCLPYYPKTLTSTYIPPHPAAGISVCGRCNWFCYCGWATHHPLTCAPQVQVCVGGATAAQGFRQGHPVSHSTKRGHSSGLIQWPPTFRCRMFWSF